VKVLYAIKDRLVDNANKWYKMATVQLWILVGVAAQLADIVMPYSAMLSGGAANALTIVSAVSIALRLYKQKNLDDNNIPAVRPESD